MSANWVPGSQQSFLGQVKKKKKSVLCFYPYKFLFLGFRPIRLLQGLKRQTGAHVTWKMLILDLLRASPVTSLSDNSAGRELLAVFERVAVILFKSVRLILFILKLTEYFIFPFCLVDVQVTCYFSPSINKSKHLVWRVHHLRTRLTGVIVFKS